MMQLQGSHVRLWPYSYGQYHEKVLLDLYALIVSEQAIDKLFWGANPNVLDKYKYPEYFVSLMRQKILILIEHNDQVAGCAWFDNIYPDVHAHYSVFMRRSAWGHPAREATRLAVAYGFEAFGWSRIFAQTPWPHVVGHARAAVEAKLIAKIPKYTVVDGKPRTVYILSKERD